MLCALKLELVTRLAWASRKAVAGLPGHGQRRRRTHHRPRSPAPSEIRLDPPPSPPPGSVRTPAPPPPLIKRSETQPPRPQRTEQGRTTREIPLPLPLPPPPVRTRTLAYTSDLRAPGAGAELRVCLIVGQDATTGHVDTTGWTVVPRMLGKVDAQQAQMSLDASMPRFAHPRPPCKLGRSTCRLVLTAPQGDGPPQVSREHHTRPGSAQCSQARCAILCTANRLHGLVPRESRGRVSSRSS